MSDNMLYRKFKVHYPFIYPNNENELLNQSTSKLIASISECVDYLPSLNGLISKSSVLQNIVKSQNRTSTCDREILSQSRKTINSVIYASGINLKKTTFLYVLFQLNKTFKTLLPAIHFNIYELINIYLDKSTEYDSLYEIPKDTIVFLSAGFNEMENKQQDNLFTQFLEISYDKNPVIIYSKYSKHQFKQSFPKAYNFLKEYKYNEFNLKVGKIKQNNIADL